MNRRRFLTALAAIPGLGFLAPRADAGIFRRADVPTVYEVTDKGLEPLKGCPVTFRWAGGEVLGVYTGFNYRQPVCRPYADGRAIYEFGRPWMQIDLSRLGVKAVDLLPFLRDIAAGAEVEAEFYYPAETSARDGQVASTKFRLRACSIYPGGGKDGPPFVFRAEHVEILKA